MLLDDEDCPVSDQLLGRLYSQPENLTELLAAIGPQTRAQLALYCYGRSHLRAAGLALAATCEQRDLISAGGRVGDFVFQRAQAGPEPAAAESYYVSRKRITLASLSTCGQLGALACGPSGEEQAA